MGAVRVVKQHAGPIGVLTMFLKYLSCVGIIESLKGGTDNFLIIRLWVTNVVLLYQEHVMIY